MSFLKIANKSFLLYALLVGGLVISLQSCGSDSDVKRQARDKVQESVQNRPGSQTTDIGNAAFHYACPNGHLEGSDVDGGTCSQCGAAYTHNDAYHQQQAAATTNTSGLFHYTCPNGHAQGGDAMGGTCPECGAEFIHNDAYHQQEQQPLDNSNMTIDFGDMDLGDMNNTPDATPSNTSANFHYACPNGHEQGSESMGGSCSECGAAFVHSDAYHAQGNQSIQIQQPSADPFQATPMTPQNTGSTVFHYTCPNGHEGGSNSEGSRCAVCGTALEHNAAFHNQGF